VVIAPCHQDDKRAPVIRGIEIIRAGSFLPQLLKLCSGVSLSTQFHSGVMGKARILIYAVLQVFHGVTKGRDRGIQAINSHWLMPSGLAGAITASILGKPHVATIHGSDVAAAEVLPLRSLITNLIARHCSAFTSVSQYLGGRLFRLLAPSTTLQPKIHRVPMGVDEDKFRPHPEPAPDRPRILFVGRLDERKGAEYLLEAASMLVGDFPDMAIRIVGDGPLRRDLERRSHESGLAGNVDFAGPLPNSELPGEYAKCQVVVVPSATNGSLVAEGLGLVAVEAAMSGRAIVASNIGGIPEVVQDHWTGLLVRERSPQEITSALRFLLCDRNMRVRFSKRGRAHSLEFSEARAADRLESALEAAMEGRNAGSSHPAERF